MTSEKIVKILNSLAYKKDPSTNTEFSGSVLCNDDILLAIQNLLNTIHEEIEKKKSEVNKWPSDSIFEDLRIWRNDTAYQKHLRPYHICTNETLWSIVNAHIVKKDDLLLVHGIGERLFTLYGNEIYAVLKPYIAIRDKVDEETVTTDEQDGLLLEPVEDYTVRVTKTCRKCMLYRREDCFGRTTICEDFILSPDFTDIELMHMHALNGGATEIRLNGHGFNDGFNLDGSL